MTDKIVLEREYNIPLRREFCKVPKYKRAKKSIKAIKEYISRHMKTDNVKLDLAINLAVWKNGITNPPHHIKVKAKKYEDGKTLVSYADNQLKILNKIRNITKRQTEVVEEEKETKKATKKVVKKAATKETKEAKDKTSETKAPASKKTEEKVEAKKEKPVEEVKEVSDKKE